MDLSNIKFPIKVKIISTDGDWCGSFIALERNGRKVVGETWVAKGFYTYREDNDCFLFMLENGTHTALYVRCCKFLLKYERNLPSWF